jgi:hypothetical protein
MKRAISIIIVAALLFVGSAWGEIPPAWGLVLKGTGGSTAASRPSYPSILDTSDSLAPDIGAYLFNNGYGSLARNYVLHADSDILTNATAETGMWVSDGLEFNANYEHVKAFLMSELDGSGTIVFGYKYTTTPTNYYYWFCQDDDYSVFAANVKPSGPHIFYTAGQTLTPSDSTSFLDGNWHQLVYTWDDSANSRQVFLDGVSIGSSSNAFTWNGTGTDYFRIGGRPTGIGRFAGGIYSYFYIYDSVLSSSQVSSLYSDPYQMWTTCDTEIQSYTETPNNGQQIGDTDVRVQSASKFTASESTTVCKVRLPLKKTGVPEKHARVAIYSDSSGVPGARIGNWSSVVYTVPLGATYEDRYFAGLNAPIVSGTVYYLVVKADLTYDGSNYFHYALKANVTGADVLKGDSSGNWVSEGNYQMVYTLYK